MNVIEPNSATLRRTVWVTSLAHPWPPDNLLSNVIWQKRRRSVSLTLTVSTWMELHRTIGEADRGRGGARGGEIVEIAARDSPRFLIPRGGGPTEPRPARSMLSDCSSASIHGSTLGSFDHQHELLR